MSVLRPRAWLDDVIRAGFTAKGPDDYIPRQPCRGALDPIAGFDTPTVFDAVIVGLTGRKHRGQLGRRHDDAGAAS